MPRTKPTLTEDRLSIRASADQKRTLKRAAVIRRTSMSQFVLEASLMEADRLLESERSIMATEAEFDWLCQRMDEPPRDLARLRSAMTKKPVWDA